MRISDWSSDVCSSDLRFIGGEQPRLALVDPMQRLAPVLLGIGPEFGGIDVNEIHQHRPVETRGQILRHLAREGDDMADAALPDQRIDLARSEEHTSELQSLMRNSYAAFCFKK